MTHAGIYDPGEGRTAAMDGAGIDVQDLLHTVPGPEILEPLLALGLPRQANNVVADAVSKYRGRFLVFATLPMRNPAAAALDFERAVRDLGSVGALINSHINGRYLDDEFFWPLFECAERLGVPIYLHPTVPPQPVRGFVLNTSSIWKTPTLNRQPPEAAVQSKCPRSACRPPLFPLGQPARHPEHQKAYDAPEHTGGQIIDLYGVDKIPNRSPSQSPCTKSQILPILIETSFPKPD